MVIEGRWHRRSPGPRRPVARIQVPPFALARAGLRVGLRVGVCFACGHASFAHAQAFDSGGPASTEAQTQGAINPAGVRSPGNGGAPRDPWRFTPSIAVDEIYSDNINLRPRGQEQSDLVTTVSPSLTVTRFGPRMTVQADYSPQFLYYARGTNGNGLRNYLDASANAALIENLLFFDARANIYQTNISPYGSLSADTVNGSSNRAEQRSYTFGPTLRSHEGRDLTYQLGYRYTGSSSDSSAYTANHTDQAFGSFQSGTALRNLGWGADASYIDQSFGNAGQIVSESASGNLTYLVVPTFRLRGTAGYDRNSYPTTGQPDLKGPSYTGGFDWTPSQHTQLHVQYGHRYFGPTSNISFVETTSKFSINALYSRDQTTSQSNGLTLVQNPTYAAVDSFFQGTVPDPAQRAAAVAAFLAQSGLSSQQYAVSGFLSNQLYLQKRAQVGLTVFGLRNTFSLVAFRTESQALSALQTVADVFDQSQKFRQTGYTATLSHRLGPRTDVNVNFTKTHNVALIGSGDTKQRLVQASLTRQIQRHLYGSVTVRNTVQTGSDGNLTGNYYGGNYRENAVLGSLRLTF